MSSTSELEKTETKEKIFSPHGMYNPVQESTTENVRDNTVVGAEEGLTREKDQ